MSGGGAESGVKGFQAVVVSGSFELVGDDYVSLVGRTNGWGVGGGGQRWRRIKLVGRIL